MSKRAASYVTLRELMDDPGVDPTRFFFVMRKANSHLDFDLDIARKQSKDNPYYYAGYAHARICNIYVKGLEEKKLDPADLKGGVWRGSFDPMKLGPDEIGILKVARQFHRRLEISARDLDPAVMAEYLRDLSGAYQSYYEYGNRDTTRRVLHEDESVRRAKSDGLAVTCEVTPHHLLLTADAVMQSDYDPNTKVNPPLRGEEDRQALVEGLRDGTVDAIATDHAPHHPDEKLQEFDDAPFGMVGLETAVPLLLDRLVRPGVIDLKRLVALVSLNPARILGLEKGTLKIGADADITLLDPDLRATVDVARFRSKSRNSPFHGWTLTGWPCATVVGGRVVHEAPAPARA